MVTTPKKTAEKNGGGSVTFKWVAALLTAMLLGAGGWVWSDHVGSAAADNRTQWDQIEKAQDQVAGNAKSIVRTQTQIELMLQDFAAYKDAQRAFYQRIEDKLDDLLRRDR